MLAVRGEVTVVVAVLFVTVGAVVVVGLVVLVALLLLLLLLISSGGGLSGARCLVFLAIAGDNGGRKGIYSEQQFKLVAGRVSIVVVIVVAVDVCVCRESIGGRVREREPSDGKVGGRRGRGNKETRKEEKEELRQQGSEREGRRGRREREDMRQKRKANMIVHTAAAVAGSKQQGRRSTECWRGEWAAVKGLIFTMVMAEGGSMDQREKDGGVRGSDE